MSFDEIIGRRHTWALKWENPNNCPGKPDILPFWVADMDFGSPQGVLDAVRARADHPIFGYTIPPAEYFGELSAWYAKRYGIDVPADGFILAPAVMPCLGAVIRAFSREGEGVLVMPPVYHLFFSIIRDNERVAVEAPLSKGRDERWVMDEEVMERAVKEAARKGTRARIVLISSPHNPVGRVWTREELDTLLGFAERHGLAVVSDEIHGDIVFKPGRFVSLAADAGTQSAPVVVLSGPNKTFNLAGLHISHAVARGAESRRLVRQSLAALGVHLPNVFSMTAALAAYRTGAAWLDDVLKYMRENFFFLRNVLSDRFPAAAVSPLEGTYLAWIDFSALIEELGLETDVRLVELLEEEGRVKFSAGSAFGTGGAGYVRINLACPRATLAEGIERTVTAVSRLRSGLRRNQRR